jgi:ribosomal protein L37AE/L43A
MNTLLKNLEFELAYLSLLTREGLKPLSRWEKGFDGATQESLQALGLKTRVVERSVQSGKRLRELLFSASEWYLDAYAARFDHRSVSHDPESTRTEGRLFGYPACCVESYVARGYVRNSLRRRDQRILFHWACPQCTVTPGLVPLYRRAYRATRAARRGRLWQPWVLRIHDAAVTGRLRRAAAVAAWVAALGALPVLTARADPLDPHVTALPLADDPDQDGLTSREETILGTAPLVSDENGNAVPDGVDLALTLSVAIDALPTTPSATQPYVKHYLTLGLETCSVCGAQVNMGSMEICHPLENQTVLFPYIAKHFLEHGSFAHSGSIHSGRLNPPLLRLVLTSQGLGHFLTEPSGTDVDNDGLRGWEEPAFSTDPLAPDTDGDGLRDGIDAAREMRGIIDTLPSVDRPEDGPTDRPFVVKRMLRGIETCPRCGESWTMGTWEVINPVTGDSITISTMALHYLEHGGFSWHTGELLGGGRVDPRHLQAVLTGNPNQHLLPVTPDQDGDWLADPEELALGQDVTNPDEDLNAVRDGLDLARAVACEIAGLPTAPGSNQVYRLDFPTWGMEQCDICGTNVNMGHLIVCNPQAQLTVEVPYLALHYLEHDSFSFAGSVHGAGRTDVKCLLDALFRPAVNVVADGSQITLRWTGRTGRRYQVSTAPDLRGPWSSGPVLVGDGTELVFNDTKPADATARFYKVVVR